MKRYLPFFIFFVALSSAYGQDINRQKLDSLFDILSKKNLTMGNIAISKNGKIVYQRFMGSAMINDHDTIPASAKTEYRIGSITKMFTAVLAFQLIQEHKLSLDDNLAKFFPGLPNAKQITIRQMMYHRSGLPNFTDKTNFDDWKAIPKTHDELLAIIAGRKPDFEPGAKADYNNSNYLLLGYVIEKIYNKSYSNVLNDHIIKKIGLNSTYYGATGSIYTGNECASYKYFDYKWTKDPKPVFLDNFGGAGAIISTSADLLKFINALFTYKLVDKHSLDQMKTMIDDYGMGMFPYGAGMHRGYGHNGKTEGFASSVSYYPDDNIAIAYCTNGEVYSKNWILDGVRNIVFNESYIVPAFKSLTLSDIQLGQYTGTYGSPEGITVVCTNSENNLLLETRGQKLKLDAIGTDRFMNARFGFFFIFSNAGKHLQIVDVESEYELEKK